MLKTPIKCHQLSLEVNEGSDTKKKESLVLKRNNRNLTGFCQQQLSRISNVSDWLGNPILVLWLFSRSGEGSKTVLGSIHVVKQLSFSMFLSILTCEFDLILGSFLTFLVP